MAVCFLWHFPASRLGLPLAITLLCEVRTFLDTEVPRPPSQLIRLINVLVPDPIPVMISLSVSTLRSGSCTPAVHNPGRNLGANPRPRVANELAAGWKLPTRATTAPAAARSRCR